SIHIVFSPSVSPTPQTSSHFTPFSASDVLPRRAIASVATSARKDNFKRSLEKFIQSQPIDDQGTPIQPSQEEIMDMWIKAAGDVHKGVYGLGSEFSLGRRTSGSSDSYSSLHCSIDLDEFEQLNRKVAMITELYLQERAAREEEAKRREEEDRRREEEERRREEEKRRKDDALRLVSSDIKCLKS
uniref:MAP7 domain-containing protein 2-like n=1 Tax=Nicotiana tabacum TaxID=4097 RepID=A0A1S3XAV7_TOBAC